MSISRGNDDLIAAIYDAAIDPSRWDEVVKSIVEATKSVAGGVLIQHTDAVQLSATQNRDPFYVNAYIETWHKHHPLLCVTATTLPGELRTATYITQTDIFRALAFFNEYMRPQQHADYVAVGLLNGPNSLGHLILNRSPDAIWVEPKEWNVLKTLAPHLARAAAIHERLARTRVTTDSLGAAVAATGFAVFLLAKDCRVLFANPKAEDLIRCGVGLRYEHGRLAAKSPALAARLRALARDGARPDRADGDIGGTLELPCGGNGPPLVAHVIPLAPIRTAAIFDLDRTGAALFIVDPAAGLHGQIRHFAARFGLTPAETRVLAEIIAGKGLLAAAAQLKITEATARSYAKHIFEKTQTHRQSELIRRFFETSLPGSPLNA